MKTKLRDASGSPVHRRRSPRLAGLVVPSRVDGALATAPVDAATLQTELLDLAYRLATQGDERSLAVADDLVTLVSRALTKAPGEQGAFALRLYATSVPYFERIGRLDVPLRLARQVTACVTTWPGPWARRCAHQFAALVHLRAGDARQAWADAECAYDLAAGFEALSGRFETLVLVVSILDHMSLADDAKALALQLLEFPDADPALATLHLVNAINGLSLCHRLDDGSGGSRFHRVAAAMAAKRPSNVPDPLVARFEAANALHLVRLGSARTAARRLDDVLSRTAKDNDPRTEALLRAAQAEVYAALDDRERMDASLQALKASLSTFHPASASHCEMLKTVIRLQLRRPGDNTAVAMRYLGLLRERPCIVTAESADGLDLLLENLSRNIGACVTETSVETDARLFQEVGTRDWAKDPWRGRRFADITFESPEAPGDSVALTFPEREAALRTPAFETAENWAVVAEIAIGGDGRQCFKVGRIAAGLSAALGSSDERTMLVELACRLRNIGDATIGPVASRSPARRVDRSGIVAERAQAGARILSFSPDPVLQTAARIALHHRAWWNGGGVPATLAGLAIPIEARMCAVADHLVSLVDPIGGGRPWPIDAALRQLRCMAGVQLDPELVEVLDRVLHDEGMRVEDVALRLNATTWTDPLARARKQMIETLELAH